MLAVSPLYNLLALNYLFLLYEPKNTADQDSRYKNLALSTKQKQRMLKVILLLQISCHDFEPTFIILVLIGRILPDQPK